MFNRQRSLISLAVFLILASCKNTPEQDATYFDSLVATQVIQLSKAKATVIKKSILGKSESQATFTPDSLNWTHELDAFRQLALYEKPAYRDAYHVEREAKDPNSNLFIRRYTATRPIPVSELQFYYYKEFKNLKRIDAVYQQENVLYATRRRLVMEFDEVNGLPVLSAYSMNGLQKMILSDTVKFSVQSKITYSY